MAEKIYIYDEIGDWGISAKDFVKQLDRLPKSTEEIDVHISSPGGDMFQGVAMFNSLKNHKAKVRVHIDGLAASAASIIAMAGDEINIAKNAMLMIHMPLLSFGFANSKELREMADLLDKLAEASLVPTYSARTGISSDEIWQMLDAETWLSSDEALAMKFVDVVTGDIGAMNSLPEKFLNSYKHVPELVKNVVKVEAEQTTSEEVLGEPEASSLSTFEARLRLMQFAN